MNNSLLQGTLQFDLTESPKVFTFTDTTDYSDQNINLTQVNGLLKAIDPDGFTFHNNTDYNTPDIDANVSLVSDPFPLPLDANNKVKLGVYNFLYKIRVLNEVQIHLVVDSNLPAKTLYIQGNYVTEIANGSGYIVVDTGSTSLTIVSTSYDSLTDQTAIVVNENFGVLTDLATFRYALTKYYEKNIALDYQYVTPTVCLEWQVNMDCSSMTIVDKTAYPEGSGVERLHTVHYPDGIIPAKEDIESPLQTLTISPIWTGTFTDTFTADITLESGILTVNDSVRKVREMKVSADSSLCGLYGCIGALVKKYAADLITQPRNAESTLKNLNKAMGAFMAYIIGQRCGKPDYKDYLDIIKAAATECGCDCGCDDCQDDTPVQVVGICGDAVGGSDFTIVIESTSGSILVSSETVGSTTTFDLNISVTFLNNTITDFLAENSITLFEDVDTTTDAPLIGESLVWNGTKWVPNKAQLRLKDLIDVLSTLNPTDGQVIYWDAGDGKFKAKTIVLTTTLAALTDVDLELVLDKDNWDDTMVLYWDKTADKWYAARNLLESHTDVNTTGLTAGKVLRYTNIAPGEFEWQPYTPVSALDDLSDVSISSPSDGDSLVYTGSPTNLWQKYRPTFINTGIVYGSGYSDSGLIIPAAAVGYSYDKTQRRCYMHGVIGNANGTFTGMALLLTVPSSAPWPIRSVLVNIVTQNSSTGEYEVHPGTMSATGELRIQDHLNGNLYIDGVFWDVF